MSEKIKSSVPANAGHVVVKDKGDWERLYHCIELVEQLAETTQSKLQLIEEKLAAVEEKAPEKADLEGIKKQLQSQLDDAQYLRERLDYVDRVLQRGNKRNLLTARDEDPQWERKKRALFQFIADVYAFRKMGRPIYGEYFNKRTVEQVAGDATTLTDAAGGFSVDDELMPVIITLQERFGVARRIARIVPMRRPTIKVTSSTDLPKVYWETELTPSQLSAPAAERIDLAQSNLVAKRLHAIHRESLELVEDADLAVIDFTLTKFALAIAKAEDQAYFVDNVATKPFTGLLPALPAAQVETAPAGQTSVEAALITGDGYLLLLRMLNRMDEAGQDNAVWVFHRNFLNTVRGVRSTDKVPLWQQMAAGPPNTLFGIPYVTSRVFHSDMSTAVTAPTRVAVVGDFSFHLFGDRRQLEIAVSEHAAFEEFGMVWRITERIGMLLTLSQVFAALEIPNV